MACRRKLVRALPRYRSPGLIRASLRFFQAFFFRNCISWGCNCAFVISMPLALDQHLVVQEEASFLWTWVQCKNLINYSHLTRCPWISLNTSWSSSILASHQEPINALELRKYWEMNHKLTIKFLKVLLRSLFEAYCRSLRCQRKLLLLLFSFKKHSIIAKVYINCYLLKCMHKLCEMYLHEIFWKNFMLFYRG